MKHVSSVKIVVELMTSRAWYVSIPDNGIKIPKRYIWETTR